MAAGVPAGRDYRAGATYRLLQLSEFCESISRPLCRLTGRISPSSHSGNKEQARKRGGGKKSLFSLYGPQHWSAGGAYQSASCPSGGYMRRFGPYGKETCQQTHQDLLASLPARTPSQPAGTLCVYWDAPEITSAARCRTDVGVEIGSSEKAGRGIAVQTLSGGIYGVCKFAVFEEQLDPAWEWALAWIAARGFIKSDKPCYEYYYNETDVSQNYYVFDICIPLQTTPEE